MQRTWWVKVLAVAAISLSGTIGLAQSIGADDVSDQNERPRFRASTEVIGSRVAEESAAAGRREVVLTRAEIAELPVQSIQDLLTVLPGVGLVRRGARGVQGDLNLRGGTFEQALILVNGLRVNNPQTGHHNLDLYVPLAAIERVEVLYGPGSSIYGPDAFGGAINFVTGVDHTSAFIRGGENDLTGGGVAAAVGESFWFAAEREVHTGFRENTEAEGNQFSAGWSRDGETVDLDIALFGGHRHFGAHAFYSARFPDERERTTGRTVTARLSAPVGSRTSFEMGVRFDRHSDDFILDRERPDWYRNRHTTHGILMNAVFKGSIGPVGWAAGAEFSRDEIDSSNLGDRDRERTAIFAEVGKFDGPTTASLQVRSDQQNPWGTEATVSVGGQRRLSEDASFRWSYGDSFRAPSFTELHYTSPSSVGNPDLEPERAWTAELGLDYGPVSLSVFERRARHLVDYVLDDDGVWRATNLGRTETLGAELVASLPASGRLRWQRVGVVYLDSDIDVDPERSAYALAHPELELTWTGSFDLCKRWSLGWTGRFRDPGEAGSWATLDLSLERRILSSMTLSLEASNLLDRGITELHGVPLPGRWITATLHFGGGSQR